MIEWTDVSSFSQRADRSEPNSWCAEIGRFRLRVHRHIHYPENVWLASCDQLFSNRELVSLDADEAKKEAVRALKTILTNALQAIVVGEY
jgi:hypothetical protein